MIAGNSTFEEEMSLLTLERNSPSPHDSESEDQLSCSSYEGFVAKEGCVMCLSPRPGASVGKHGGSLRIIHHLRKLLKLMRDQDAIKLAVELEKSKTRSVDKYMVVVATTGVQDTEETIVLGTEQDRQTSRVKVCLFLPLWRDTEIKLNGDGGFSVNAGDNTQNFKPRSVQSMWTALQVLFKATDVARLNNYYVGGLSHTWMMYYKAQLTDDGIALTEWNLQEDVESFRPFSPESNDPSSLLPEDKLKKHLVSTLKELMLHADLEEVTSRQLRLEMEKQLQMDLKGYRGFLDQQMMYILGQMEKPSQIQEYLFLGSEWNAANLIELRELGVGYILNMTREIDNFYPEAFKYKTIRLFDVPESDLLKHWDDTYKFIKEAKEKSSKVLVHCKMGVSRSAATTMAYIMKEYTMTLEDAFAFVKSKRSVINPNHGFMSQLKAYEGILRARYNKTFGLQVPSRLSLQSRSSSDPNLKSHLTMDTEDAQGGYMPDMKGPACTIPIHDGLQMRSCSAIPSGEFDEHASKVLENRVADSLPPEKAEGMKSYLASLPPVMMSEDDMDQGITVPSPSDSGSPYSSPFLTPPDDEHINQLLKAFQENNRGKMMVEAAEARQERSSEVNGAVVQSASVPTSQGSTTQNTADRQPVAVVERTVVSPISFSRTTRTASLPTPLRTRNTLGIFAPRSPLFPPSEDTVITESSSASSAVENVGVTVCSNAAKTVQDRIKEIEGLNNSSQPRLAMLERPESDGSSLPGSTCSKRISGGSLTNASSDESLASPRFSQLAPVDDTTMLEKSLMVSAGGNSTVDEITFDSKSPLLERLRRSTSPSPPCEQVPSNTHHALQSPLEKEPPEQTFGKQSPSADKPSPTTSSPSNVTPSSPLSPPPQSPQSKTPDNQDKMVSLMMGSLTTPNSPGTQYKNAIRAAAQLAQQRGSQPTKQNERDISASADDIWDSSATKGVKELSTLFSGGSLGRSWSMRERERPVLPIYKRKVSGSVSPCFDTERDGD